MRFGTKKSSNKGTGKSAQKTGLSMLQHVLYGNIVSSEFFVRHWVKVFLVVIIVMISISTKYQCMTAMEQIKVLQTKLNVARTECVRERSTYMSRIRESAMKELVDATLPGLAVPEHPAYVITLNPENKDNSSDEAQ